MKQEVILSICIS